MSYQVADVERLLSLLWDSAAAFGCRPEEEPEPGMPKAKPNLSKSNTLYAELADISRAWFGTPLRREERVVLLATFGLRWTSKMIEKELASPQQTVSYRKCRGVDKIKAFLNGEEVEDGEDE